MPNWCSNQIRIEGPAEEIQRIWDIIEDTDNDDGLLTALAPLEGGWEYHTAIDHWGTKWDIKDHGLSQEVYEYNGQQRGILEGYFESAWGPPAEALDKWLSKSEDHEGELLWYEPGNDFCGRNDNGNFEQFELSSCTKTFFVTTDTGEALDEAFGILEDRAMYMEEEEEDILYQPATLNNPEEEPGD